MTFVDSFTFINEARKSAPVDVERLCRDLGIELRFDLLSSGVSGMIERKKGEGYIITVNASDPETRRRFTIAHELGHYVYHRDIMGDGIDDDRAYRSTDAGKYHNTRIGRKEEIQANKFAARLLMPEALIRQYQKKGMTDPADLARQFGVSEQAMKIRIGAMLQG
ncbi:MULTISPECIES: ImmA/IrrE family metallo-endopeptidase [Haematospirillum]|uniref:ImmA/IrrE family metallo-endopeptidase n=1 Tax=Haematospirillum TaxID=1804663 RepID=UPI00143334C3|nr:MULTISPECIES: ImmA/IrrE family metallo-endopeptidase [Haematospirillum]NKD55162.1 ImmA/IrrE family metallo-endopeptidase [Haematospirillum sp. H4890]NKD75415.1 ImmA/IrrE family metallo-endopeptidase [Haematospirillum sp. H4485]NKD81596.1 ImmA/IrrE family metallo-endopeptidase [Haematospirillum jordaniae]NKD84405.1 ImmA/IrrE family metallo-endopeptidase [Haematospirillum jordaniae]NKD86237.1 ImmA/IrrE family metallo-endopeptidase [Haematospirillum jordaniae]